MRRRRIGKGGEQEGRVGREVGLGGKREKDEIKRNVLKLFLVRGISYTSKYKI